MSYNREQQGGKNMMDLIALGILIICFGCVKLFANFCESLINPKEKIGGYKDDRSWNFSFITCRISCVLR